MFAPLHALLSTAWRAFAERSDLLLENLALRHQLAIYERQNARPRFRERDRKACFGQAFVTRARTIGIETVVTPFREPKANAIAERMVGTFRRECLDHVIVLNEQHLRSLLNESLEHHNGSRPHQSLVNTPPVPVPRLLRPPGPARVAARPVLR